MLRDTLTLALMFAAALASISTAQRLSLALGAEPTTRSR